MIKLKNSKLFRKILKHIILIFLFVYIQICIDDTYSFEFNNISEKEPSDTLENIILFKFRYLCLKSNFNLNATIKI